MPKSKRISVSDSIKTKDALATFKKWFDGAKKFFTVKVEPPKRH